MFESITKLQWIYRRFKLKYSVPFIVLMTYTIIGAAIFRNFEREVDQNMRMVFRNSTEYAFNQVTNVPFWSRVMGRIMEITCSDEIVKANRSKQLRHAKDALLWFVDYLNLTEVIEERSADSPWTWYGSMFYAGQLYTTIGYGLPVARTSSGHVASIIYIMIGIPIFLIFLKDVGQLWSRAFRKLYKRYRTAKKRMPEASNAIRRLSVPMRMFGVSTNRNNISAINGSELANKHQNELIEDPDDNSFPISLALSILIFWICFSAALFCLWESEWGYLTSVYFFFVSISTVGLGDVIPSKPDMMIVNFMLILIGLALLSMCVNLIQIFMERMLARMLQQYIDEIEKIAAIVTDEGFEGDTVIPFEIGEVGDCVAAPFAEMKHESQVLSFQRTAKEWVAEKIASNLLASGSDKTDSDSDEEMHTAKVDVETPTLKIAHVVQAPRQKISRLPRRVPYDAATLRTIEALEKARSQDKKGGLREMVLSKMISSCHLSPAAPESEPILPKKPQMVDTEIQTDAIPRPAVICRPEDEKITPVSVHRKRMQLPRGASSEVTSMSSMSFQDIAFDFDFDETISPVNLSMPEDFSTVLKMIHEMVDQTSDEQKPNANSDLSSKGTQND